MTDRPPRQAEPSPDDFRTPTGAHRAYTAMGKKANNTRWQTIAQWVGMVILAVTFWGALIQIGACNKDGGWAFPSLAMFKELSEKVDALPQKMIDMLDARDKKKGRR